MPTDGQSAAAEVEVQARKVLRTGSERNARAETDGDRQHAAREGMRARSDSGSGDMSTDEEGGTGTGTSDNGTRADGGSGKRTREEAGSSSAAAQAASAVAAPASGLRNDKSRKTAKIAENSGSPDSRGHKENTKRKAGPGAEEADAKKAARGPARDTGRAKRKTTAAATERSRKEARVAAAAQAEKGAKRKRADTGGSTVTYVDNGKGGDRSLLRTVAVSSLMVDRVVGDQYEWRDRSYRTFDDGG